MHEPATKSLGLADQLGLWGSLGITLTLPIAAAFLPAMSLLATLTAVVVGSVAGLAAAGLRGPGGRRDGRTGDGADARALRAARLVLADRPEHRAVHRLDHGRSAGDRAVRLGADVEARCVGSSWSGAGIIATLLALRPLGAVRLLRKYAVWFALAATIYLFIQVLRRPLPSFTKGGWTGFGTAVDLVIALPVSWIPLAADYSRHSKTPRAAFLGAFVGFATTCTIYFALGVLALVSGPARQRSGHRPARRAACRASRCWSW